MTYKALIDYCNNEKESCFDCPYKFGSCNKFIEEVSCAPWIYDFLKREEKKIKEELIKRLDNER